MIKQQRSVAEKYLFLKCGYFLVEKTLFSKYCTYLRTTAKAEHLISNGFLLQSSHVKRKKIFMKIFLFPTLGAGQS